MIRAELLAAPTRAEDNNYHNPSHQLLFLAGLNQLKLSLQLQLSKQPLQLSCQHLPLHVLLLPALHLLGLLLPGLLLPGLLLYVNNKNNLLRETSMQTDLVAHQEDHHP